jgi:hypothetical protein
MIGSPERSSLGREKSDGADGIGLEKAILIMPN